MIKYKLSILAVTLLLVGFLGGFFAGCMTVRSEQRAEKIAQVVKEQQKPEEKPEVKDFGKPALVYFYAPKCTSCQKFRPNWNHLKKVYKDKFHFVEIDVDNPENVTYNYEFMITTIPQVYLEDAPFKNRVFLNPVMYHYMPRFKDDLDRYLQMRELLKKGS